MVLDMFSVTNSKQAHFKQHVAARQVIGDRLKLIAGGIKCA